MEIDDRLAAHLDNGPGIPPEVVARRVDPFFTTKPKGQGMGLALDIVRRALVANRGQIAVVAEPGHTEFHVSIPIVADRG